MLVVLVAGPSFDKWFHQLKNEDIFCETDEPLVELNSIAFVLIQKCLSDSVMSTLNIHAFF